MDKNTFSFYPRKIRFVVCLLSAIGWRFIVESSTTVPSPSSTFYYQEEHQCLVSNLFQHYSATTSRYVNLDEEASENLEFNEFPELSRVSLKSPHAFVVYPNGDEYKGALSSNAHQIGFGTYRFMDGRIYDGSFVNGFMEGWGRLQYPAPNIVEEFGDVLHDGSRKSTIIWEGEMKQGEPNGKGIWYFPNGDECEALTVNGNIDGDSLYKFNRTNEFMNIYWDMGRPLIPKGYKISASEISTFPKTMFVAPIIAVPHLSSSKHGIWFLVVVVMVFCACGYIAHSLMNMSFVCYYVNYFHQWVLTPKKTKAGKKRPKRRCVPAAAIIASTTASEATLSPMSVADMMMLSPQTKLLKKKQDKTSSWEDSTPNKKVVINKKGNETVSVADFDHAEMIPSCCSTTFSTSSSPYDLHNAYCGNCEQQLLQKGGSKKRSCRKKLIQCGCHQVSYCSKECQSQHWLANHKDQCKKQNGACATTNKSIDHGSFVEEYQQRQPRTLNLDFDASAPLPPHHLRCPITGELLIDPVLAPDGETYEKEAIKRWIQDKTKEIERAKRALVLNAFDDEAQHIINRAIQSPLGFGAFMHLRLTPNRAVKRLCEEWKSSQIDTE